MMKLLPVFPPCSGLFHSLVIKLINWINVRKYFFPVCAFSEKNFEVLFENEKNLMASCYNLTDFYNRYQIQGQIDC